MVRRTTLTVAVAGLVGLIMLMASFDWVPAGDSGAAAPAAPLPRCSSGVRGDVNGDGYAEVAVGESGNAGQRGAVHVFYGQRSGLVVDASGSAPDDQYLTQDSPGVAGVAERGDSFGASTLLADLNGDGCADLVVGSPGESTAAGWVQVFFGSPDGVRTDAAQSFTLTQLTGSPANAEGARLGSSLTAGDVDGDGVDDLVAGAPWLTVGSQVRAGAVGVVFGGRAGLDLTRSVMLTPDSPGVPGDAHGYGYFGTAVATGDFDGNGATEFAVSSMDDGLGRGAIQVLARTDNGFSGIAPLGPAAAGLPDRSTRFCAFGSSLASGDVHGDGRDDLVVGVPRFGCTSQDDDGGSSGTGAVVLLPGSANGVTTAGSQLWTQDSPGVQGTARADAGFGSSLTLAQLDRDGTADLVIGAPIDGGGSVTVLLGSAAGLTTDGFGGARLTQSTPGIPGTDEGVDSFGAGMTAGFVQSRVQATIVISAPGEGVGTVRGAGSITQIPVGPAGPDPSSARTFNADSRGVKGKAGADDNFGGWS